MVGLCLSYTAGETFEASQTMCPGVPSSPNGSTGLGGIGLRIIKSSHLFGIMNSWETMVEQMITE
jgi:hypothetical protein